MIRVANKDARGAVEQGLEFKGSNTFAFYAETPTGSELYVVCSYGLHFPMFIREKIDNYTKWYENQDKYSKSTSKQQGQLRPHGVSMLQMETDTMIVLSKFGIAGVAAGAKP